MSLIAVETAGRSDRKTLSWLKLPLLGAVVLVAAALGARSLMAPPSGPAGMFHTVSTIHMDVKVAKDGELHAVSNIDIVSRVEGQNTIQQIVSEGTTVRKGEVLLTLDSAQIRQRIEDTTLNVQKAEADLTNSREMLEIQRSQNAANLEAAEVALMLAQLDLEQYVEGTYPQQLADAQTSLEMARVTLKNRQEDLEQTRSLHQRGFVTAADEKKAELDLTTATNNLRKAETTLTVLTRYTHQMTLASKRNAVAQAEQRLARVKRENASGLAQRQADVRAKEQALAVHRRRLAHLEEQLAACTIEAPADGLVVYASSGNRNAEPIQEGTQVRERQLLLRLPDTTAMKAVVRIQESQVPRLEVGQRAVVRIVGVPEPIGATLRRVSVMADGGSRWWNPDLKEYPVDLVLDHTPSDLKPGVGVQAEIFIERLRNVIAVPLASIYAAGSEHYVFVRQGGQLRPQRIQVGSSNATHVQITSGLHPGQEVLLLESGQGRDLLEQAGIEVRSATTTVAAID
jgi:HlyD family secretion protein